MFKNPEDLGSISKTIWFHAPSQKPFEVNKYPGPGPSHPKNPMDHAPEGKKSKNAGPSLELVPAPQAKSPGRIFLENPDSFEPMTDQLMGETRMLAMCSKRLYYLYQREAKSWKGADMKLPMDRTLISLGRPPIWTISVHGHRISKQLPVIGLKVELATISLEAGKEGTAFHEISAKTWGELQMEVRKECKKYRAVEYGPFRVLVKFSRRLNMRFPELIAATLQGVFGLTLNTTSKKMIVDKDNNSWFWTNCLLYETA